MCGSRIRMGLPCLGLSGHVKSLGLSIPTLFDTQKTTANYLTHEGHFPFGSDGSRSRDSDFSDRLCRGFRLEHRIFGHSHELHRNAQRFVSLGTQTRKKHSVLVPVPTGTVGLHPEGMTGLSPGFLTPGIYPKLIRPNRAVESVFVKQTANEMSE